MKEWRPQGHADQNWSDAKTQLQHAGPGQAAHSGHQDKQMGLQEQHANMAANFRQRFWISLVLTLPILALSTLLQTLVAVVITTAYLYSSTVVFGLAGKVLFWELATLVDIMLLGHWIEMKSVMGASKALEERANLIPSEAHKLMSDGSLKDVLLAAGALLTWGVLLTPALGAALMSVSMPIGLS